MSLRGLVLAALVSATAAGTAQRLPGLLAEIRHRHELYCGPLRTRGGGRADEVTLYRFLRRCAALELPAGRIFVLTDWWPMPDMQFWFYPRRLFETPPLEPTLIYGVRCDDPLRIVRSYGDLGGADERVVARQVRAQIQAYCGDIFRPEHLARFLPGTEVLIGMNTALDLRGTPGFEVALDLGPQFYLLRRIPSRGSVR